MDQADIPLSKLQEDIQTALQLWHSVDSDSTPFDWLQLFQQTRQGIGANREATNKILLSLLDALASDQADNVEMLRQYFLDGQKMRFLARARNISESTAYRRKSEAIKQLASILWVRENRARERKQARSLERLEPVPSTGLIGVEEHRANLSEIVLSAGPPWLISIEGLGGLGKTSLAATLARDLINRQRLDDFGWVSARTRLLNPGGAIKPVASPALTADDLVDKLVVQLIPAVLQQDALPPQEAMTILRRKLKQGCCLVVIDNLETVRDIESLLPLLRDLSNPARFLLTSRHSLKDEPDIFHFPLPELSQVDTLRLIRQQAELRNLSHLKQASEDDLKKIYTAVGGNPLAILLVIGQTHHYALDDILTDLQETRGPKAANLYTYIFQQAWGALGETAQKILLAMPLVIEQNGTLEYLRDLTGVGETALRTALDTLMTFNLINSQGDLHHRRYTIHHLTRTFLQEQVIKW